MIDLSFILISWNTAQLLVNCLRSVPGGVAGLDYESIVIDSAPSDGSAELIVRDSPAVTLMRNATNIGYPCASNQGFNIATGRYVLLLDSDTLIRPNALTQLVQFMDQHPEAGGLAHAARRAGGAWVRTCHKPV